MNDMISRLKDVVEQTQKLRLSAPSQNVSRVRGLSENLSEALIRMIRAVSSSPEAIPSLRIARFVTAAEGANQNMIRLTSLRGQNQEEDTDLDAAEEDLADVVGILVAAAESARLDVVSSIKSDLSATRDLINAWNMPAVTQSPSKISDAVSGAFVSAFNQKPETPLTRPVPKTSFMSRMLWKQPKSAETEVIQVDDGFMRSLMHGAEKATQQGVVSNYDLCAEGVLNSPSLSSYGLNAQTYSYRVYFTLSGAAPEQKTRLWESIAENVSGASDALHRALLFKDDPEFRASLESTLHELLSSLETQALGGVPLPTHKIKDPVVSAAVTSTLRMMGKTRTSLKDEMFVKDREYDPFDLRARLKRVMEQNPGISIEPYKNDIVLMTCDSINTPTGVAAELASTLKPLPLGNSRLGIAKAPLTFVAKPGAEQLVADFSENLMSALDAYDDFQRRHWLSPVLKDNPVVCERAEGRTSEFRLGTQKDMTGEELNKIADEEQAALMDELGII